MPNTLSSWIKKSTENAVKIVDKDIIELSIHVLGYREDDLYVAHCLEFDIVSDGKTEQEACQNCIECVQHYIEFCVDEGSFENAINSAPREYWQMFFSKGRSPRESKVLQKELSTPVLKEVRYAYA